MELLGDTEDKEAELLEAEAEEEARWEAEYF